MYEQRIKELMEERDKLIHDFDKVNVEDRPRYYQINGAIAELLRLSENEKTHTCEYSGITFSVKGSIPPSPHKLSSYIAPTAWDATSNDCKHGIPIAIQCSKCIGCSCQCHDTSIHQKNAFYFGNCMTCNDYHKKSEVTNGT